MTDCDWTVLRTPLCDLLGCDFPILLAGMGGVARWELAAAVAVAGGFPTLGIVREQPALIEREVLALRAATSRPCAVNLIPAATDPVLLDAQIACCLNLGIEAFSFFWDVVPEAVERVKATGCLVIHQIGTEDAARDAEAAGADVLIAQGIEAGGHVHGRTAAFDLAKAVMSNSRLPVVVSGGIADGAGLASALSAGFAGVQCGTAFLATDESFAHDHHKRRIVEADGAVTVLTDAFVLNWPKGAAVRVLRNEVIARDGNLPHLRYSTDSPLRTTEGDLDAMALYAGQGVGRIDDVCPAGLRLKCMAAEAERLRAETRVNEGCKA